MLEIDSLIFELGIDVDGCGRLNKDGGRGSKNGLNLMTIFTFSIRNFFGKLHSISCT